MSTYADASSSQSQAHTAPVGGTTPTTTTTSTKRRRVDAGSKKNNNNNTHQDSNQEGGEYGYVATPSTSRTAAKAAAKASHSSNNHNSTTNSKASQQQQQQQASQQQQSQTGAGSRREEGVPAPALSLASLPPPALQRYLSRYGLLESHGSLSYHHAVFPVPPLPSVLPSPLIGRQLASRRLYRPPQPAPTTNEDGTTGPPLSKKQRWQEPKTLEFRGLTAYDDPVLVTNRLAAKAKEHWDKRESVKEGETLTNFMFALRMRAHTLRATPPG